MERTYIDDHPTVTGTTLPDPIDVASHLESLPPELLRRIFEYALPQGFTFSFEQWEHDSSLWTVLAAVGGYRVGFVANKPPGWRPKKYGVCYAVCFCRLDPEDFNSDVYIALSRVNKAVASEARAVLFAGNTFSFNISAKAHSPVSFRSPRIFGPFGLPHRSHLLRDLRHINLEVDVDELSAYTIARHRGRLQHFVNVMKEHADDDSKKSLLRKLYIRLNTNNPHKDSIEYLMNTIQRHRTPRPGFTMSEGHMFTLEPLISLQGIPNVNIVGVPDWFKKCLEMRMRGEGGELTTLTWPVKLIKRRPDPFKKAKKAEISTREGWQPRLDWREFAQRNSIAVPAHIDIFFPPPQNSAQ